MGIRFRCHQCQHPLHVKDFQAGKKSRCPECQTRFRIPASDAEVSIPIRNEEGAQGDDANGASVQPIANETVEDHEPKALPAASKPGDPNGSTWNSGASVTPKAVAEAPNATWFVRPPSGGQYGPAAGEMLMEWIGQRRVTGDSLVWREGLPEWRLANEVLPEVFPPIKPTIPPPPPPPPSHPPTPPTVPPSSIAVNPISSPSPFSGASAIPAAEGEFLPGLVSSSVSTTASSIQHKLMMKQMKKRKQQMKIITILSLMALLLIVVLIVVIIWNPMAPPTVEKAS